MSSCLLCAASRVSRENSPSSSCHPVLFAKSLLCCGQYSFGAQILYKWPVNFKTEYKRGGVPAALPAPAVHPSLDCSAKVSRGSTWSVTFLLESGPGPSAVGSPCMKHVWVHGLQTKSRIWLQICQWGYGWGERKTTVPEKVSLWIFFFFLNIIHSHLKQNHIPLSCSKLWMECCLSLLFWSSD